MGILVTDTPPTAPVRVRSAPDFAEQPVPTSPTSIDGWGELENGLEEERENDKDGWDDLEPLEEMKPTPALANIQAAQRRPVSQPVSQTKLGINYSTICSFVRIPHFPVCLSQFIIFGCQIGSYLSIY